MDAIALMNKIRGGEGAVLKKSAKLLDKKSTFRQINNFGSLLTIYVVPLRCGLLACTGAVA